MKKLLLIAAAMLSISSYAQFSMQQFNDSWTGTPAAPPGWTVKNIGGGMTWEQTVPGTQYLPYGGTGHAALLKIDPATATNPVQEDWLISPVFMAPNNPYLHFQSRLLQEGDQGSIYKVMIGTNPNDLSTFTAVYTATELVINPTQLEYTEKVVAVPAQYTGQQIHIAFVMAGSNADGWLVDNVEIISECNTPTNLTVSNATGTSATLNWTQADGVTSWEVEVINSTAVPSGQGMTVNAKPIVVTSTTNGVPFTPNGSYKYYVRALCSDGGVSSWVGPLYFSVTLCPAPTNVTLTEVGLNSLTYSWTPTEATIYDFWVTSVNGAIPNASTVPSGMVVEPTVVIPAVVPGQEYAFYVRAVCGPNNFSPWAGIDGPANPYDNMLHGKVLYDSNADGICNDNDAPLPFAEVQVTGNGAPYSIYTNQNGQYVINGLLDGAYTLNLQVVSPVFSTIAPVVQEVTFTEEVNEAEVNHCLGQPLAVNDLEVTFIAIEAARPGFNATYKAIVYNAGSTLIDDVVLNLSFDNNRITYVSSGLSGVTASAGSLSIAIGDVQPFSVINGNVVFYVMQPPTNIGGEVLHFEAGLSEVLNDATPDNNEAVLNQVIVNSFDPNDITVHEGAEIKEEQADDYLTYTIRFQNTGTAEAINIKLENTLDDLLDWTTFEPITSSHSYNVKRTENLLEFEYDNIFLPDSTANEPESHGFVTYRIKPKAEYGLGDIVSNNADIYFDFNEAIHTNIATTEVVETAGLNDNAIAIARLYPNPVKDQLFVVVKEGELQSVTVYDINGRLCLSANAEIIDTNSLNNGIYFVKITTDAGSANYKIIKQ